MTVVYFKNYKENKSKPVEQKCDKGYVIYVLLIIFNNK